MIHVIQASFIHFEQSESFPGDFGCYYAVMPNLRIISNTPEQAVGDTGGATGPPGQLCDTFFVTLHLQDSCGSAEVLRSGLSGRCVTGDGWVMGLAFGRTGSTSRGMRRWTAQGRGGRMTGVCFGLEAGWIVSFRRGAR